MRDILQQIDQWREQGHSVAIATVIHTTGSTPRPLGSRLAVSEIGAMAGSVSGGCIEGAVFEEAQQVIGDGQSRTVEFGVSDEQAWSVGLSCGGTIEVLIERLEEPDPTFDELARIVRQESSAWVITDLGQRPAPGSDAMATPPSGQRWIGNETGVTIGSLGAPELDQAAKGLIADETLTTGISRLAPAPDREFFVEQFQPLPKVVIVGAVHVAIHLVHFAKRAGFHTTVVDARTAFATRERFPHADDLLVGWPSTQLEDLNLHEQTYCVFLSHDPKLDDPALVVALRSQARYVGALGSTRTHRKRITSLKELGLRDEQIDRICAPIGLDLGGRRPEEIALSIAAELVAVRYGRA